MLTGVLPYMEGTDMTKSQIAAAKQKNMLVVLSLKMKQHSTKWYSFVAVSKKPFASYFREITTNY